MNWTLPKLFAFGKIKYSDGQIKFFERSMVFVPLEFYIEATREIVENNDREEMLRLYLDAWKAGVYFMKDISKRYSIRKFEQRFLHAMDIIKMAGFGDYQTFVFKRAKFSRFRILNNELAKTFAPSKHPVCHILRGFNAGGGTIVHEKIMNCIEPQCTAINGMFCLHMNANTEILRSYENQKLVARQLDLKYLLKEEQKFLKKFKLNKMVKL